MHKERTRNNLFAAIALTILIIYTISLVIPMLWAVLSSLKDPIEFELNPFGFNKTFVKIIQMHLKNLKKKYF